MDSRVSYTRITNAALISGYADAAGPFKPSFEFGLTVFVVESPSARWLLVEFPGRYSWQIQFPTAPLGGYSQVLVHKIPMGFEFNNCPASKSCRWSSTYDRSLFFTLIFSDMADYLKLQHVITRARKRSPVVSRNHPITHTATMLPRGSVALRELFGQLRVDILPTVDESEEN